MLRSFLREKIRRHLRSKTNHPRMQAYLDMPLVNSNKKINEIEFLALDLEMSGLDSKADQIVSIGYVPIRNLQVVIAGATHEYVYQSDIDLQQSAPIHNISHRDLETGQSLEQILNRLLAVLRGKVLILHHAPLDMAFLNRACKAIYQTELLVPTIDTLALERHLLRNESKPAQAFRLHACRARYGLPAYTAHNAITDAIATAELWLAQQSHSNIDGQTKLRRYLK